jgi:hypothetical protein
MYLEMKLFKIANNARSGRTGCWAPSMVWAGRLLWRVSDGRREPRADPVGMKRTVAPKRRAAVRKALLAEPARRPSCTRTAFDNVPLGRPYEPGI